MDKLTKEKILRVNYYLVCSCGNDTYYIMCDHPLLDHIKELKYVCTNCGDTVREIIEQEDE